MSESREQTLCVWKYELYSGHNDIVMPKGAVITDVMALDSKLYLWALVEPDASRETRYFRVIPTGYKFVVVKGDTLTRIGTVKWRSEFAHVFEY